MSSTYPTGLYYSPSTSTFYNSYNHLRHSFPAYSVPNNVDIPELGIYQLWYTEMPEEPEGFYVTAGVPVFNEEDQHWYQTWVLVEEE